MKNLFFCTLIALSAPAAMASRTAYDGVDGFVRNQ